MTTVTFLTEGKRIIGFDAKGHSGYAEAGSDIVCAAITSAVRLVDATVNDVLGLAASVKVHERSGSIEFRLPGGLSAAAESTLPAAGTSSCVRIPSSTSIFFARRDALNSTGSVTSMNRVESP